MFRLTKGIAFFIINTFAKDKVHGNVIYIIRSWCTFIESARKCRLHNYNLMHSQIGTYCLACDIVFPRNIDDISISIALSSSLSVTLVYAWQGCFGYSVTVTWRYGKKYLSSERPNRLTDVERWRLMLGQGEIQREKLSLNPLLIKFVFLDDLVKE